MEGLETASNSKRQLEVTQKSECLNRGRSMGKEGCGKLEGWKSEFQAFVASLLRLSGEFNIAGGNWVEKKRS